MIAVVVEMRDLHERFPAKPGRSDVKIGDEVLVSNSSGLETATVVETEKIVDDRKIELNVIRLLNEDDYRVLEENKAYSSKVMPEVTKAINDENLDMKLTYVSYTYDRQKLYVYYTAENRVDFRKFIKTLGAKLKLRIQMVQIGVRDKASIVGGLGICGREICCSKFLRCIKSVNIDMARNQQISLNPENISGCCGRLLCCLRYENDVYLEARKYMPKIGEKVTTPDGKGDVIAVNFIKATVRVKIKSGTMQDYPVGDVKSGAVKETLKKWIK